MLLTNYKENYSIYKQQIMLILKTCIFVSCQSHARRHGTDDWWFFL